jgi:hypothetical protein
MSAPAPAARRRAAHVLFAAAVVLAGLSVVVPALPDRADAAAAGVTRSVTATRTFVEQDGTETKASSNRIDLKVSQVTDLRGRQEIHVTWDGAIPTGGVVGDPNSSDARNQEYPFVLLQCRGVDTRGRVPDGQVRLSPETCWTQTSQERYLAAASSTPSWRFDRYAAAGDRKAVVGQPNPLPKACAAVSEPLSARWLPFRAAGGQVYHGGPDPSIGCTPLPPESDSAEGGGLPSNTTYGITGPDGHGETDFAVWTAAENASLGCSVEVSCALVAVPIVGVSCDTWGHELPRGAQQTTKAGVPLTESELATADATCRRTGAYQPGEARTSQPTDQAVRGNLWWSASNWRHRITVPLGFATTGQVCDAISKDAPVELMGSVVLNELTASWRPTFCTTKSLFTFTHVQQSDSLARTLVDTGEIDGAFSSAPKDGGYSRPVVQAPISFGGFAIAFNIDDANRQRTERLNLDARLVAKLLTSSYPAVPMVRDAHPSIGGNPLNITLDPEFQALNPGLPETSTLEAAAALQVFSASSDLVWALTSWIDADPEARAWLDGTPDPWGMTVNANYEGVDLPVDNWPLLDNWVAPEWYQDQNACYGHSPTPFMQLVANPPSNISSVLVNMQFANSAVATVCRYDGYDATTLPLRPQGRQTVGYRFVLGVVSVSAARRYNLRTAALQTTSSVPEGQQFADAAGRTFVAPDTAGLRAAAGLLKGKEAQHAWALDYGAFSTSAGARAYPGAMPVYAVLPTTGLDETVSTQLAKLLCYADTQGQVPGQANGRLPAGYLPVTADSGLGEQHDYLLTAAAAVRAQAGTVPKLTAAPPSRETACDFTRTSTTTPTPSGSDGPDAGSGPVGGGPAVSGPSALPGGSDPSSSDAPDPAAVPTTDAATVLTAGQESMLGRLGLPGLLFFALACGLAGALVRWYEHLHAAAVATPGTTRRLARRAARWRPALPAAVGRRRR